MNTYVKTLEAYGLYATNRSKGKGETVIFGGSTISGSDAAGIRCIERPFRITGQGGQWHLGCSTNTGQDIEQDFPSFEEAVNTLIETYRQLGFLKTQRMKAA